MDRLTAAEITNALVALPGWKVQDSKLHREYRFPDFAHAIGFLMTAAPGIERLNHHPEWSNVYNRVTVDLTTHDAGGITQRDISLAEVLEGIAQKLQ
jgi:4a-hydroxytetrahydrobiopterin dehydratase